MRKFTKSHKGYSVKWVEASDIKKRIISLANTLDIDWIKKSRIFCFRSENSKTRAQARIWGFSKVWQQALKEPPAYVIEVISEKFDGLSEFEKDKVLLHELTHIPRNFSGSLVPHYRRGPRSFPDKVRILIAQYNKLR